MKPVNDPADEDRIYSDVSVGDRVLTWKELVEDLRKENQQLHAFRTMVLDLDRNPNGRHEGDADVGTPGGVSLGNLKFLTGSVLGYDISGRPYVVPPRVSRHDPAAWRSGE